ncbi:MAG: outer membrane beta-barrel protein [Acidobacteria bacterium]|nr:outer membrane beta-barrel protein [Acidobacteriota bacterium]
MCRRVAIFLIPFIFFSLFLLGAEEKISGRYRFNGVAGYLHPGRTGCEDTTSVFLSFEYLFSRNVGMSFGGGFTNFRGPHEIMIGGQELKGYMEQFSPLDIRRPRLELQYGTIGLLLRFPAGKLAPYINLGVGAYQYTYTQDIFGRDPQTGQSGLPLPLFYRNTSFGVNGAVGMEYLITEFLSVKFEGNYQRIFSDLIKSQFVVNAGFGFIFE